LLVKLKPYVTALPGISVTTNKKTKSQKITQFKKKEVNVSWGGNEGKSSMIANLFPICNLPYTLNSTQASANSLIILFIIFLSAF